MWNLAKNFEEITKILISEGADVNDQGKEGYTPLHLAAEFGRKGVAKLISKGAKVNSRSRGGFFKKGKTPLGLAVNAGHQEVVDLLKQYGAKEWWASHTCRNIQWYVWVLYAVSEIFGFFNYTFLITCRNEIIFIYLEQCKFILIKLIEINEFTPPFKIFKNYFYFGIRR